MAAQATKTQKQPSTVDKIRKLKSPRTKQAAREILDTRFTTLEDERVRWLLERNSEGRITPDEKAELDICIFPLL